LPLDIYGVRYPPEALATLARYGVNYRGWLPNARAPEIFARHLATVHVPRRFYTTILPGHPDHPRVRSAGLRHPARLRALGRCEGLFRAGRDFLFVGTARRWRRRSGAWPDDPDLRAALVQSGLETIHARHTCAHRAESC
jgi:spore maturation protein CgeB